ncbi:MAG: FtsW/RodA/SpoVE family cell cycle protein [Bacteroidaceae bacterium]|nr:FtsW/RodA/SpoVE family cell cycle protein [Bacteroidaceae bacterium]
MNISKFISERVLVGNKVVWTILFLLLSISMIEVYSASSNMTYQSNAFWRPVMGHTMMIAIGVAACCVIARLNMTVLKLVAALGNFFSIFLLLCALFIGERVNGATRWVFGLQPSEVAKGILVMTIALILSKTIDVNTKRVSMNGVKACLAITFVNCALIAPENLSTAGLTFLVVFLMMFVGQVSLRVLAAIIAPIIIVGGLGLAFMKTTPMETIKSISEITIAGGQPLHRLPTWANRLRSDDGVYSAANYPINDHLQVAHAKIAIATSGIWGCGPGNSVERDYLPQAFSDFIFAIIIEELGLAGGIFVLLLYIALLFQVGSISRQCTERFPQLLSMGLAMLIVSQALFNLGVAVGLLPVTGQQLPLVSRGGTGIILNCCYIGMILATSRAAMKTETEQTKDTTEQETIEQDTTDESNN